jgi:hypothetical protein
LAKRLASGYCHTAIGVFIKIQVLHNFIKDFGYSHGFSAQLQGSIDAGIDAHKTSVAFTPVYLSTFFFCD